MCLLNDANAAALGEMWKGAAQGKANLLFVTLGTGVGGGIVLNGEVLNGCHSSGGEIGHIPIRSDEQRLCGCGGRNCLETFASANGLALSMRKKLKEVNEIGRKSRRQSFSRKRPKRMSTHRQYWRNLLIS